MKTVSRQQQCEAGLLEWFWYQDHQRAEQAVELIRALGVKHLRFGFSWADWCREGGQEWFDWLVPKLAESAELLPCFTYTPPSLGEQAATNSPPRRLRDFADFVDQCLTRHGEYFEYVELWNEPNNGAEWDFRQDYDWRKFSRMIIDAASWTQTRGFKTVLGGMSPIDVNWLTQMFNRGVMDHIDVVGIHGFPGSFDTEVDWRGHVAEVREIMRARGSDAQIWITETGYPTWRHDEWRQAEVFCNAMEAPVERVYWLSLFDLPEERPSTSGDMVDLRDYHFGIVGESGPKLLFRQWRDGGMDKVRQVANWRSNIRGVDHQRPTALVTGGAGFIGTNLVENLVDDGYQVRIMDTLSRAGVASNLDYLRKRCGSRVELLPFDVRDRQGVSQAVAGVESVYHLAAQVAVTSSLSDPRTDFQINLDGTFNLLEAIRRCRERPNLVFASTNKVYGGLDDIALELNGEGRRYQPADEMLSRYGISERRSLDFHSPYGCSKGAADQYVMDYARCFDIPAVVLRMSCVYGPHQHGTEDQGWVAHFMLRALEGAPINIYGDGCQVRDVLHVDDAVAAWRLAAENAEKLRGRAYNLGGGAANAVSLLELIEAIAEELGTPPRTTFSDWRQGDQRWFVADSRKLGQDTGWAAQIGWREGAGNLLQWFQNGRRHRRAQRITA